MAEIAEIFENLRAEVAETVSGLSEEDLTRPVPATPEWTIRDIVSHLTGDIVCLLDADFPREFFEAFGDENAVKVLNDWTDGHIKERRDRDLKEVLDEWAEVTVPLTAMMRGERPWPDGVPPFADRVLLTDLTVHQQDIYGALGVEGARTSPQIRIATAGYVAILGMRLQGDGLAPLRLEAEDKVYDAGGDEPAATVKATRYEFFRALSGRRSVDQVRAYRWSGDPEPYIPYFYPYGVRQDALVE